MKEIVDAMMQMLMQKGVITVYEYNEYLIASETARGTHDTSAVVEAIKRIGRE